MIRAVRLGNSLFHLLAVRDEDGTPLVFTLAASFAVAVNYPNWPRKCFDSLPGGICQNRHRPITSSK